MHDANSVLRETGLHDCFVSRWYHLGPHFLQPGMPLIWNGNIAGVIQFFCRTFGKSIYDLRRDEGDLQQDSFQPHFPVEKAVLLKHFKPVLPTWWLLEGTVMIMLL